MLTLVGVLAGGCSSQAKTSASSQNEGQALTYQYTAFDQLDPQRVSDGAPIAGQDLLEGMVTPDAAGTGVVPATADTWTVSQDGTVYTFHIRSDAKWSNGTPVTAQDFESTYKRLLTPSTSTLDTLYGSSSYQADLGIKNAANFQLGKVTDWSQVGVKALDTSHLRITLDTPNTNFLQGMAYTSMVPLPRQEPGEISVLVADAGALGGQRPVRDEVVDAELDDGPRPQRATTGTGKTSTWTRWTSRWHSD